LCPREEISGFAPLGSVSEDRDSIITRNKFVRKIKIKIKTKIKEYGSWGERSSERMKWGFPEAEWK
jgi:hypothetical protein